MLRAYILIISLFVIYLGLALQLGRIQILEHRGYQELAEKQHYKREEIPAHRGRILDRNGKTLAQSLEVSSVFANPKEVEDKKVVSKKLSRVLGLNPARILELLERDKEFVWIKRVVGLKEAQEVKELGLSGVDICQESRRSYPCDKLLSQVIGFVDIDEKGLEGIELSFDRELSGQPGYRIIARDGRQRPIFTPQNPAVSPVHGDSIILTIDLTLQHIMEEEVDKALLEWRPRSITAIAMSPSTGEIMALTNRPTYDPNYFVHFSPEERRNRAITDCYEPGSIIKPLVVSGLLKRGLARPEDVFFCSNGVFHIGKRVLHDVHPYGDLTLAEILIHSSNIGMAKLAMIEGQKRLYSDLKDFGFGEPTGIELPGEISGALRHLDQWTSYSLPSIAMGHELTATPLQMLTAYSAIANGGTLMKPRIVRAVADNKGEKIKRRFKPESIRRVVNERVAREVLTPILTKVVEEGTGKRAYIKEYAVAGKTGTSQKARQTGKGYGGEGYVSSFVGYAPAEAPKLCVLVMINEPHGGAYYGGTVTAPVVREILRRSLHYLGSGVSSVMG